jgi:hypothetical protein
MKNKAQKGKLRLNKLTIHTLLYQRAGRIKGGTFDSFGSAETADINCSGTNDTGTIVHTATNNLSCPGGYSCLLECIDPSPGATAIGRCATGGLCIPSYSCNLTCGTN